MGGYCSVFLVRAWSCFFKLLPVFWPKYKIFPTLDFFKPKGQILSFHKSVSCSQLAASSYLVYLMPHGGGGGGGGVYSSILNAAASLNPFPAFWPKYEIFPTLCFDKPKRHKTSDMLVFIFYLYDEIAKIKWLGLAKLFRIACLKIMEIFMSCIFQWSLRDMLN